MIKKLLYYHCSHDHTGGVDRARIEKSAGVMGGIKTNNSTNNVKAVGLKDWTTLLCFGRQ